MSKEKQIEEMAEEISDVWNNKCQFVTCNGCKYSGLNDDKCQEKLIADHLIAKGYRKQSEWISVEERLPNCEHGAESEAVLFITKQGFMYTGYYGCGGIFHDRYFREFKNATEGYDISNVTHWMPFPEAPKGGEE